MEVFTQNFINKFKKVLINLYGYEEYMDFLIVPSIFGNKTLSYLSLLNYSDRTNNNITDLLELAKDNDFQIRVLNFDYQDFKTNDTVTMRLNIENKTIETLYKELKSKRRNLIKKSLQNNFILKHGNTNNFIDDFYKIFSNTMYKHGTPVFDKKLFYFLRDEFENNNTYYIAYDNERPIAAICMLFDEKIAWYPWGGVESEYSKKLAGYFIYWKTVEEIVLKKKFKIFDFGRSSYGGNTYKFKSQFGAKPVKIDIISNKHNDIYNKYDLAISIWKKLPKNIVDFLGPKLCKYLEDL